MNIWPNSMIKFAYYIYIQFIIAYTCFLLAISSLTFLEELTIS